VDAGAVSLAWTPGRSRWRGRRGGLAGVCVALRSCPAVHTSETLERRVAPAFIVTRPHSSREGATERRGQQCNPFLLHRRARPWRGLRPTRTHPGSPADNSAAPPLHRTYGSLDERGREGLSGVCRQGRRVSRLGSKQPSVPRVVGLWWSISSLAVVYDPSIRTPIYHENERPGRCVPSKGMKLDCLREDKIFEIGMIMD
jgi:hypothetical protein